MLKKILIGAIGGLIISMPANAFTFAVYGDSRSTSADVGQGVNTEVLSKIVTQLTKTKTAFHIFLGDLALGDKDIETQKKQLNCWKQVMKPVLDNTKVYITFGSGHDTPFPQAENILRDFFDQPMNGPDGLKEMCYSFDYENAHFVSLDLSMPEVPHKFGEKQMKWLEEDLQNTPNKDNIFVFSHEPAFPTLTHTYKCLDMYPSERDKFWDILVKYNVKAYLCGHEHLYSCRIIKGIPQLILGGAGAPLYKGGAGEFYNYAIFDIDKDSLKISVYDENGNLRDNLTRDKDIIDYINKKIAENERLMNSGK